MGKFFGGLFLLLIAPLVIPLILMGVPDRLERAQEARDVECRAMVASVSADSTADVFELRQAVMKWSNAAPTRHMPRELLVYLSYGGDREEMFAHIRAMVAEEY